MQQEHIAGTQPESRRFVSIWQQIAVAYSAIFVSVIVDAQFHLQNAVVAAQILWFRYAAAGSRTCARIGSRFLRMEGQTAHVNGNKEDDEKSSLRP